MSERFPKAEKLKSSKIIAMLFSEGKTYTSFPIKMFFITKEGLDENLIAFAVPKRNFKLAVNRNRVKRQLRESYRLNKKLLEERQSGKFLILFLFLGKSEPKYQELEKAMIRVLGKLPNYNAIEEFKKNGIEN